LPVSESSNLSHAAGLGHSRDHARCERTHGNRCARRCSAAGRQATVALEKAKRREPHKASIREALGIAYLRIQRYSEAEEEFRAMLEISPADHYAHYALGRALEKQGREAEANGHYKLASSLRPQSKHYASRILDLERDAEDRPTSDEPSS
jgi:Flp pilus assembly protein TadD